MDQMVSRFHHRTWGKATVFEGRFENSGPTPPERYSRAINRQPIDFGPGNRNGLGSQSAGYVRKHRGSPWHATRQTYAACDFQFVQTRQPGYRAKYIAARPMKMPHPERIGMPKTRKAVMCGKWMNLSVAQNHRGGASTANGFDTFHSRRRNLPCKSP
jgi:hypothetical protein